jgi:2-haloalkanoic acid dehalogenase type II
VNFGDFDALSFDCYGTLIDWEAGISVHLERLVATYPELPDVATLLDVYGEEESVAERETPRALYPAILAASIRATAQRYGVSITNEEAAAFGASVPDWPAFPDSADALARLQRHYKLIILSNIDRASFAASNAKLGVTFDAILTAEDIGSYKPDPANFAALFDRIESMGIPLSRSPTREEAGDDHGLDRSPPGTARRGCDPGCRASRLAGRDLSLDGRLCRRGR